MARKRGDEAVRGIKTLRMHLRGLQRYMQVDMMATQTQKPPMKAVSAEVVCG
jgi:hypothetical protein